MKNLTKIFVAVVALVAVSCTNDTTNDLAPELGSASKGQTTITLSLEESRTQLGAFDEATNLYALTWSEGDKISVNGVESEAAQIDAENSALANFVVSGVGTPYCIAYPSAGEGQVVFKANQKHNNGKESFEDGVAVMYGYGENGLGLQLKHLTGVLKIGIKGNATLSHAQISTADRAPIAGTFNLDFKSGKLTSTEESSEVINYSFGEEGLTLTEEAQYIYVAVPGGVYDELYVTLYEKGASGNIMFVAVTAGDNKPLTAGNVREFNSSIAYTPNATGYIVSDYASLLGFAEAVATATVEAPFTKDVIFVNDVVVPAASEENPTPWTSIEGYTGTIRGNGYAIEGLTTPLFGTTGATIKGLHLRGVNIVETEGVKVGAFARVYTGEMSHCSTSGNLCLNNTTYNEALGDVATAHINVGGLIGRAEGATVTDSVNGINITITSVAVAESTPAYQTLVGGCIGIAELGTTLEGLTNNGILSYEATTSPAASLYISGVVGRAGVSESPIGLLSINNCTNNGKVTATESSVRKSSMFLSGVIGVATMATVCDQLHNTAEISDYATTSYSKNATYLAGVAAHYIKNSASNFSNSGTIISAGSKYAVYAGGVAGHWDSSNSSSFIHDNFDNSGEIKISGTHTNNAFVGGVFAFPQKSPKKHNCDNTGNITVSGSVGGALKLGGILSTQWGQYANGIYKCTNSGKIHITATAVLTDTAHIGGLVGNGNNSTSNKYNNIVECYNTGAIIFEGTGNKNLYIGGLTGSQSTGAWYSDCYNTGSVTVQGNGVAGTVNAGGVVGGAYGGATRDSQFDDCYNEGAVTVAISDEITASGSIFVGGFIGKAIKDTNNHKVTMNLCENRGTISVGGKLCASADAVAYVGGMMGYFMNDDTKNPLAITECTTTEAATITVNPTSSKVVYVGGILGQSSGTATLTSNENKAAINANGTYGAALYIGGIAGGNTSSLVQTLATNTNNGAITTNPTASAAVYAGGILGQSNGTATLTSNENKAAINANGTYGGSYYLGGIAAANAGTALHTQKGNVNNGAITANPTSGKAGLVAGLLALGEGTAQLGSEDVADACKNNAKLTLKGSHGTSNVYLAGFVAYATAQIDITNCENTTSGVLECSASAANRFIVGGCYGYLKKEITAGTTANLTSCKNNAAVNVYTNKSNADRIFVGGILAFNEFANGGAILTNCENNGNITVSGDGNNKNVQCAAIYGSNYGSGFISRLTNCQNNGVVLINVDNIANLHLGGMVGCVASGKAIIKNCHNNKKIEYRGLTAGSVSNNSDIGFGGIVGYSSGYHKIDGCSNSGEIIFAESTNCKGNAHIGGISGYLACSSGSHIINSHNRGNVTINGDVPNDTYTCIGGVFGRVQQCIIDNCSNTHDVLVAEGASTQKLFVGGIGGTTSSGDAIKITKCSNSGKVESKSAATDYSYVGGVLGHFWSLKTEDLIVDIEAKDDAGASAPTKESVTSTLSGVTNTGDVRVENASVSVFVGGIVGKTAIPVSSSIAYCDVQGPEGTNIGWIMGTPRADATLATNCQLAATTRLVWDADRKKYDEEDPLFDNSSYFNYIYGGETIWPEETNYDGCKYYVPQTEEKTE